MIKVKVNIIWYDSFIYFGYFRGIMFNKYRLFGILFNFYLRVRVVFYLFGLMGDVLIVYINFFKVGIV